MNKNTKHHICPKRFWTTTGNWNIVLLKENVHQALHLLLDKWGKAQAPREQIINLFNIIGTALTDEFKNDIYKILLETDNEYYYKNWIYLKK